MNEYQKNLERIKPFITRPENECPPVTEPSFWLNDVTQPDGSKKMEIAFTSKPTWLKLRQDFGHACSFFPIDGKGGVFDKKGLLVTDINRFAYEETGPNGIRETKTPGDCDCLILDEVWRFMEFKTDAISSKDLQANNNRAKAEAQLAKSMWSFRERLGSNTFKCHCVLVVPLSFPKQKASSLPRAEKFRKRFDCPLFELQPGNMSYDLK